MSFMASQWPSWESPALSPSNSKSENPPTSSSLKPTAFRILNLRVDAVELPDALAEAEAFAHEPFLHQIVTANTLMCLAAEHDPALRRIVDEAALVVPESSGLAWAAGRLRIPIRG